MSTRTPTTPPTTLAAAPPPPLPCTDDARPRIHYRGSTRSGEGVARSDNGSIPVSSAVHEAWLIYRRGVTTHPSRREVEAFLEGWRAGGHHALDGVSTMRADSAAQIAQVGHAEGFTLGRQDAVSEVAAVLAAYGLTTTLDSTQPLGEALTAALDTLTAPVQTDPFDELSALLPRLRAALDGAYDAGCTDAAASYQSDLATLTARNAALEADARQLEQLRALLR